MTISFDRFVDEFVELANKAGIDDVCSIELSNEVRTSPRSYADVDPWALRFRFAPDTLDLPRSHRRGLLMHEIGHVLAREMPGGGTEDDADRAAERVFGERIFYDRRWPGKGLQCVGCRRRNGAEFAWHCPSPPSHLEDQAIEETGYGIVDYIHSHAEEISPDELAKAVGGWKVVLGDWWGGFPSSGDFEDDVDFARKDWSVSWYRSHYPDGTPVVFHTASGIEHVYEVKQENPVDLERVPAVIHSEIEDAERRAIASGANPDDIDYVGAGAEGILFVSDGIAYKVGRRRSLKNEALALEALDEAGAPVPWFLRYNEPNNVIVREHIEGRPGRWGDSRVLLEVYETEIMPALDAADFTRGEFKEDSFIFAESGKPIMVDLGMVFPKGERHFEQLKEDMQNLGPGSNRLDLEMDINFAESDGFIDAKTAEVWRKRVARATSGGEIGPAELVAKWKR